MHVLTVLLVLPLLGAALLAFMSSRNPKLIRSVAVAFAGAALILSWGLIGWFDLVTAGLQFSLIVPWNQRLGTSFALGVDGFSFPMVLLATLLCFLAILASFSIRLSIYRRAFLGPVRNSVIGEALDLRSRELLLMLVLTGLILLLGLWPASVLDTSRAASEAWVAPFQ